MGDGERVELGISGHSVHGSLPDWAQYIGEFPKVPFSMPAGETHPGFSESVVELLGNWTITKPMSAADRALRRSSKPTSRLYVTGNNRSGAVEDQYQQSQRLYDYVSRAVRTWVEQTGLEWHELPRGREDLR
eukprot:1724654-Pleurochrysis_carterae.AAC.1